MRPTAPSGGPTAPPKPSTPTSPTLAAFGACRVAFSTPSSPPKRCSTLQTPSSWRGASRRCSCGAGCCSSLHLFWSVSTLPTLIGAALDSVWMCGGGHTYHGTIFTVVIMHGDGVHAAVTRRGHVGGSKAWEQSTAIHSSTSTQQQRSGMVPAGTGFRSRVWRRCFSGRVLPPEQPT